MADQETVQDEFDAAFDEITAGEVAEESASEDPVQEEVTEEKEDSAEERLARLEKENERLRHSDKSQRGRVSALTKKLMEQAAIVLPPEPKLDESVKKDWETLSEEYPEISAPIEKRMRELDARMARVNQMLAQGSEFQKILAARERESYRAVQFEELAQRHPDYAEVAASPDFTAWTKEAPEDLRMRLHSTEAKDASLVLDYYKREKGLVGQSEVSALKEKRAETLKKSTGISTKKVGQTIRKEVADDFDAAFEAFAAKRERERKNRY
jgi:hypothetical protein